MAYFNKGPWKLCDSGIDVNCEAGIVAICDDPNTNQRFNACLIAAAPEMYEALKEWSALDDVTKDCSDCEAVEFGLCSNHVFQIGKILKMRDTALLKAEGREV